MKLNERARWGGTKTWNIGRRIRSRIGKSALPSSDAAVSPIGISKLSGKLAERADLVAVCDADPATLKKTTESLGDVIVLIGAKPVFIDIDPRTYNLDPALMEAAITPKTKAIMPVSLYGQCADVDAINAIANKHGIPVIEDAAQSFGATYKGRCSCALSTIGCTSFFPSKPLGCYGDGGACFTDDDALAKKMGEIRVHGQDRRYHHPLIGVNGRMDTLQAAILLAKLDSFPVEVEAREQIGARYSDLLRQKCLTVATPYVEAHNTSVYAQYTLQVERRDTVADCLKQAGVPIAIHYPVPLHLQPAFSHLGLREGSLPTAEAVAKKVLSLPMHAYLDVETQERILEALARSVAVQSCICCVPAGCGGTVT